MPHGSCRMKTVAIMQPTFIPWLGYFALMDSADEFVYLDDVQYVKRSWQSRNRIRSGSDELMLSLGVDKKTTTTSISDVRFSDSHKHKKLMKTLKANLGKAPHFELCEFIVDRAFADSDGYLSRFNTGTIDRIADVCGINTQRILASDLKIEAQEKATRLLAFCENLGASHYLSPVGSYDYLAEYNPFENSAVELRFINYQHPEYSQGKNSFKPFMACVDALAWVGPHEFLNVVRTGIEAPFDISDLKFNQAA